HSDHPVCAFALLGASTPPLRGGDWRLLLDVPLQCHTAGQRAVDVSFGIGRNAFLRAIGVWIRNGGPNLAVLRAADRDALMETGVRLCVRLMVGDEKRVIRVDKHTARPAELLPLFEEFP